VCVPICNFDGSDNLFGQNRAHDFSKNPLCFTTTTIDENWNISRGMGSSDVRELHRARVRKTVGQDRQQLHSYLENKRGRGHPIETDRDAPDPGRTFANTSNAVTGLCAE